MKQIVLFVLLTSLSACIKKSGCNLTSDLCSCDRRSVDDYPDCRDYDAKTVSSAQSECSTDGGTFTQSALCPTDLVLGTCKFTVGTEVTYQRYYVGDYGVAAAGAAACAYYKANCFIISGNALCDATWTVAE